MIDYIVFYAVSAIFRPYNGRELCFTNQQLLHIFQENFPWIHSFITTSRHQWLGVYIKIADLWPITGYIVLSCESYLPRTRQTALGGGSRRGKRFCTLADTPSPACSPTTLLYTLWIRKTDFKYINLKLLYKPWEIIKLFYRITGKKLISYTNPDPYVLRQRNPTSTINLHTSGMFNA